MFGKSLEKAYVEILDGSRQGTRIKVLFNPAEYSVERANAYKATPLPSVGSPLIQFVNGDAATLALDLFLDDWTDPDGPPSEIPLIAGIGESKTVAQRIDEFDKLLDIDEKIHAPPRVMFVWGSLRFEAVLEKVGRKVTMLRANGFPARATLSVSFKQYAKPAPGTPHVRLESPDKTKRRMISASESIWTIADKEYGDPRDWRIIADFSDVDDPRALEPGTWLVAPPLETKNALNRV
jgi:nucleoid-associated protein YgaU